MKRTLLVVGSVVCAAVLLTACPPTYPKCSSDEHCKEHNEVCVQGMCQECATDQNCKTGFTCQGNRCVPKPECTPKGNECGTGHKCEAGRCVVHECDSNADCKGGRCEQNRCVQGCTEDAQCGDGEGCEAGACVKRTPKEACDWTPVHFEFNESNLPDAARRQLDALATCIKTGNVHLKLAGHADERGTEEYNLQLSNRRAEAVKKYLTTLGVPAGLLDTIGYGETRPAVQGTTEEAYAQNRRVEFERR